MELSMFEHLLTHFNFAAYDMSGLAYVSDYDYFLVIVSYLIAVMTGYAGLNFSHLVRVNRRLQKHHLGYLFAGAVIIGGGVWAMHFIAMLAYSIEVSFAFNLSLTVISVIPAIIASFISLVAMSSQSLSNRAIVGYGLVIGLGVGLMHYIGMGAMIQDAQSYYNPYIFVLSIFVAWLLGAMTLYVRFSSDALSALKEHDAEIVTALVWGSAVAAMHYTGMAAVYFVPGECITSLSGIDSSELIWPVIKISFALIILALIITMLQRRLMEMTSAADVSQERLLEAIDQMSDGYILTEGDGRILLVNKKMQSLFSNLQSQMMADGEFRAVINRIMGEAYFEDYQTVSQSKQIEQLMSGKTLEKPVFLRLRDGRSLQLTQKQTGSGNVLRVFTDITSLRKIQQAIAERESAEERQRLIIDNMADAMITINRFGIVQSFSAMAEKVFGYRADQVVGNNVSMLMPDDIAAKHDGYLDSYLSTGKTSIVGTRRTVTARHADGHEFIAELSLAETELDGEKVFIGLVQDVSEREAAQQLLIEARERAEVATKAKSDFLANMSHEIRTPMNHIIGLSNIALSGELNELQRDRVQKLNDSALRLLGIINDILDFSKIESGKLDFEKREFSLEEVLNNMASLIGFSASRKNIELVFDVDPQLPARFIGDQLRVSQVLTNLCSNAVKFTEEGGEIVLTIRQQQDGANNLLYFEVSDNGIGMQPEVLDKLFEAFTQADVTITRKFGGTGLGLAITRYLVEAMGGSISVESEYGFGSTFSFTLNLPLAKSQDNLVISRKQAESLHVMIVDDNPQVRRVVSGVLRGYGIRVEEAENGEQAIQMLSTCDGSCPIDLLMMDCKMPGTNSVELVRKIQFELKLEHIPVVAMTTGQGDESARKAAMDVDVSHFMIKPVLPSSLVRSVLSALNLDKEQAADEESDTLFIDAVNQLKGCHLLVVEDNDINQEIIFELLTSKGLTVEIAENGQQALEILQAGSFDGILMDCQMPVMDGYTATRHIRENPDYAKLPILAMTANAMEGDRERSLASGMNDHIPKPFDVNKMFITMARWIRVGD